MAERKDYYPPMHTAEHILNRTMVNVFGCHRAFNCHIERKKSKCDFWLDEQPDDDKMRLVEQKVNEIIQQDLPVTESFTDYDTAAKKYDLKVDKEQNPQIRIVHIGDYDDCPCIGQHVKSTAEIGSFKILSYTYEEKKLRIRFKVYPQQNLENA